MLKKKHFRIGGISESIFPIAKNHHHLDFVRIFWGGVSGTFLQPFLEHLISRFAWHLWEGLLPGLGGYPKNVGNYTIFNGPEMSYLNKLGEILFSHHVFFSDHISSKLRRVDKTPKVHGTITYQLRVGEDLSLTIHPEIQWQVVKCGECDVSSVFFWSKRYPPGN